VTTSTSVVVSFSAKLIFAAGCVIGSLVDGFT
jgi:hypothetical protein